MVSLFFLSYALAWPQEIKHLRAEEAAKLHGDAKDKVQASTGGAQAL